MSAPTVQDALGELLDALGFKTMARDVRTETDRNRLARYARIVVRNSPADKRPKLASHFRRLGLGFDQFG